MKHLIIITALIASLYSCNSKHKTLDIYLTSDEKTELLYCDLLYLKVFDIESSCKSITSDFKYNSTPDSVKQEYLLLMQSITYYDLHQYYTFINKTQDNITKLHMSIYIKWIEKVCKCIINTEQYKIKRHNKLRLKYPTIHRLLILHAK